MVNIPLSKGYVAIVDDEDAALVAGYKWTARVDNGNVYAQTNLKRNGKWTTTTMHRLVLDAPTGVPVDHQNGNGLDNRRQNLRLATGTQNQGNHKLSRTNTTGYKGVIRQGNRFKAQLRQNRRTLHLGSFRSAEEAAAAYDRAAIEQFGEFALTNAMLVERQQEAA